MFSCAKTARNHMHIKFLMHGRATKYCMEQKDQHISGHFQFKYDAFKWNSVRSEQASAMNTYWVKSAKFSVKLQPHLGKFICLSVHSASLSHIDFCLQILIDVSIHTASVANQDNLSKVRSLESDNLAQNGRKNSLVSDTNPLLCLCTTSLVTIDHIFSLRTEM